MDAQRFDRLAKTLGGMISRRGAMGVLLGAGVDGAARGAAAKDKQVRHRKGKGAGKRRARGKQKPHRAPAGDAVAAEAADCANPGPSSNMNKCNFNDQDFTGIDLSSSSMRETKFRGADLCAADLSSSQLKQADFRGLSAANKTDLTRADLRSSGCSGTLFNANTIFCGTRTCNGTIRNDDCPDGADPAFACCADGGCEAGRKCENGHCCNVCADGCEFTSLAEAAAAAEDGDTIRLCAGTFLTRGVSIDKDLTIVGAGSGAGGTTLDAEEDNRVLFINPGADVELRGLRVTGGFPGGSGGGIVNQGTLRLFGVSVAGNRSEVAQGGGIHNLGTLTLGNGSRVEGNIARSGGGIFNANGTATLEAGSLVTGNTTTSLVFGGGGVFEFPGTTVTVADTTIVTGNSPNNCRPVGVVPNCVN